MSFSVRSSIISQATLMRRISRSRAIHDHSSATIEAIELIRARQPAKSVGAVSVSIPPGCSRRRELGAEIPDASVAPILQDNRHRIYVRLVRASVDPVPRPAAETFEERVFPIVHAQWERRIASQATDSRSALISPIAAADGKIVLIARYRVVSASRKKVTIVVR
jgi:hypothetical protein